MKRFIDKNSGDGNQTFKYQRNDYQNKTSKEQDQISNDSEIVKLFRSYKDQLNDINDRRERIVKVSRDITAASKKIISLLQRTPFEKKEAILEQADIEFDKVHLMIGQIINELEKDEFWRYQRSFSFGLQEYMEAISFYYYLKFDGALITLDFIYQRIKETLKLEILNNFVITNEDYLLGLADLTGELMRYTTNCVNVKDFEECFRVNAFIRTIFNGFKHFHLTKDLQSKLNVTEQNLQKAEKISCNIRIRGSEYPNNLLVGTEDQQIS